MCVAGVCTGLCGGQRVTAVPTATGPQARLKSCRPITLEKLGAATGATAQELQPAGKMAFLGGHDQR